MGCGSSKPLGDVASSAESTGDSLGGAAKTKVHFVTSRCENPFYKQIWETVKQDLAPMVVISLAAFEAHGQVPRSSDGMTAPFLALPSGAKVLFVSHRWLRPSADPAEAHPDDADGSKHRLLCRACRGVAARNGWKEADTHVWMDYFSIHQDDVAAKLAGIASLRGYAAACDAMVVPCPEVPSTDMRNIDFLPGGYGERAWTRLEALTFYTISTIPEGGQDVFAAAVHPDSSLFLERYTYDVEERFLPSTGNLFSEDDRPAIKEHEQHILQFLDDALMDVDMLHASLARNLLSGRGLGPQHSEVLRAVAERICTHGIEWGCTELSLRANKSGPPGAKAVAAALQPRKKEDGSGIWQFSAPIMSLTTFDNEIGDEGASAIAEALQPRSSSSGEWTYNSCLTDLNLRSNGIGDAGAAALGNALEPKKTATRVWQATSAIASLNLMQNNIGHVGAAALAEAMKPRQQPAVCGWLFASTLKHLNLTGNSIGAQGSVALAAALRPVQAYPNGPWHFNDALEELNLWGNNIDANGAKALADALLPRTDPETGKQVANTALRELMLFDNDGMGDSGVAKLQEAEAAVNVLREASGNTKINISC